MRDQAAYILGEREPELGRLGVRAPLQLGVHGDLCPSIHDGAIMPSTRERCNRATVPGQGAEVRLTGICA
jgi:hypothetical protein